MLGHRRLHPSTKTILLHRSLFSLEYKLVAQLSQNMNFVMDPTVAEFVFMHAQGVGALLKRCGEEGIGNIRIVQHDAIEVMDHMLGDNSLDGVHIFFPDPWHKSRHHKRRLIQSPFVNRLARHIKPGGYLHLATDWAPYAEQMLHVVSAEPLLNNTATDARGFAPKPSYRPLTKFENRGLKLGHGVWDLVFTKV